MGEEPEGSGTCTSLYYEGNDDEVDLEEIEALVEDGTIADDTLVYSDQVRRKQSCNFVRPLMEIGSPTTMCRCRMHFLSMVGRHGQTAPTSLVWETAQKVVRHYIMKATTTKLARTRSQLL